MKYYFILLLSFFVSATVYAQTIVDGYYITSSNDSVSARFKVPKMIFAGVDVQRLENKIKSVDSTQGFEKLKPDAIKGYGFIYKNKEYRFIAKYMRGYGLKFCEPLYVGDKVSLYYYWFNNRGKHATCIVEKSDGTDLVLKNSMTRKKIKNKLKDFFDKQPAYNQVIDAAHIIRRRLENSLKEIVEAINTI